MLVAVALAALALPAHNRSEGKSTFVIDLERDRIDVTIELVAPDLPELCDVDLATADDDKRRRQLSRLDACVERGMPGWLRLSTAGGACQVVPAATRVEGLAVRLSANAVCPPLAGNGLVVDWGLFQGTALEHTSVAEVRVVGKDAVDRALLSRRQTKLRLTLPSRGPLSRAGAAISVLVGAVVGGVGVGAGLRLRRRRQQRAHGAREPN